ncbi:hypothetical protein J2T58_001897 [Methanocalculus alkaliphilus]|nr:hypothetical protein [Methanocalculus alkaliphilus]
MKIKTGGRTHAFIYWMGDIRIGLIRIVHYDLHHMAI